MIKERINTLSEQTSFLLEKQKEILESSKKSFDDLLSFIDDKLKTFERGSDSKDFSNLKSIYDHIANHRQNSKDILKEDISFLQEQLFAINEIKNIQDETRAKELLNMIIDSEEVLPNTIEFKKQVCQEVDSSQKELAVMVDDIKEAIENDDWHELKLFLEALNAEEEKNEKEGSCCGCSCDACDSCNDCESCEDVEVSSCCDNKCGVDIFSNIKNNTTRK